MSMKAAVVVVLLLVSLASATATADLFRAWAASHGRLYTAAEEKHRLIVFQRTLEAVQRLNAQPSRLATFGLNRFSDLTDDEFASTYASLRRPASARAVRVVADGANDSLDMSAYLPPIKDQLSCGSCWAFSAVANAEGQHFLATGAVVALSEQQLVSCDKEDTACDGGDMVVADKYIVSHGLATEEEYPYVSGNGSVPQCTTAFNPVAKFSAFKDLGQVDSDEQVMELLRTYGPLSAGVEAMNAMFRHYKSGILDNPTCKTILDHGVAIVGWGTDQSSGTPYWLIRNSWGTSWGESGYIRIIRGKNMCGINGGLSTLVA
eukprot:m51a1_g9341 putative xylem cysteine proteinase 1-like isoform x2 (320) ;mRNA; f:68901-69860